MIFTHNYCIYKQFLSVCDLSYPNTVQTLLSEVLGPGHIVSGVLHCKLERQAFTYLLIFLSLDKICFMPYSIPGIVESEALGPNKNCIPGHMSNCVFPQ